MTRSVNPVRGETEPRIRLRLDVSYVGSEFHGWQIQNDLRTVQGELRNNLSRLLGRIVTPVGAGRTDSGVHARGQVAHLTVASAEEAVRVTNALPAMVPDDIGITAVRRVSPDFNACFSAVARRYSYSLLEVRDIFRPFSWRIYRPLDRRTMNRAAADLKGSHDFSSFCKTRSLKADGNVCHVDLCNFDWTGDSAIFHVRANRFLHHMVRNLVGTLVAIGHGTLPADCIPAILAARDRNAAGKRAPAHGLFMEEVYYPDHVLDPAWRDPDSPYAADSNRDDEEIPFPEEGESP